MTELTTKAPLAAAASGGWEQIALPLEPSVPTANPAPAQAEDAAPAAREALGLADRAPDSRSRRDALARVYAHLAQRAVARGHTPVPKAPAETNSPRARP